MRSAQLRQPPLGRLGAYELLIELAAGGMGAVFLARAAEQDAAPLVAIKRPHRQLAGDDVYLTMLFNEARLASTIVHPNVVRVRELGFEQGRPFLVMNYVESATLHELRTELESMLRRLHPAAAVRIVLDALAGLEAAHDARDDDGRHMRIVHRDVSPHNLLVAHDGQTRLADFGLATGAARADFTGKDQARGKLRYVAPERVDGRNISTVQGDVYAMGVCLWEAIANRLLFTADDPHELYREVVQAPVPSLISLGIDIPQELDDVIARAVSRDLDVRYRTAAELVEAIQRAAEPLGIAKHEQIATLLEDSFEAQLCARHDKLRAVLGEVEAEKAIARSGLPVRTAKAPSVRGLADVDELEPIVAEPVAAEAKSVSVSAAVRAPVAKPQVVPKSSPKPTSPTKTKAKAKTSAEPKAAKAPKPEPKAATAPKTATSVEPRTPPAARSRRLPWLAAACAALAVGAVALVRARPRGDDAAPPQVDRPAETRRIVVQLPFAAQEVTLDKMTRHLDAPVDSVVFDVPAESAQMHEVSARAVDGARVEGTVREVDGVVRLEDDGLEVTSSSSSDAPPSTSAAEQADGGQAHARNAAAPRPPTATPRPQAATDSGTTIVPVAAALPSPASPDAGVTPLASPPSDAPAPAKDPGRSTEELRALVLANRPRARGCYEKALETQPGLGGDVVIRWVIDPSGHVSSIELDRAKSTLTEPKVVQCIIDVIRSIKFAESPRGLESRIGYPFNFKPGAPPTR